MLPAPGFTAEIQLKKVCVQDARALIVIVVGNGNSDPSSNPGRGRLHFI